MLLILKAHHKWWHTFFFQKTHISCANMKVLSNENGCVLITITSGIWAWNIKRVYISRKKKKNEELKRVVLQYFSETWNSDVAPKYLYHTFFFGENDEIISCSWDRGETASSRQETEGKKRNEKAKSKRTHLRLCL